MLNKIITFLFVMSMFTEAREIESEIGINIGLNSTKNDGGSKFKNPTLGITYQNNEYVIMPRVDIEYVKVKNDYATSLLKGSVNAVYEYENKTYTIPYVLAGVGYEYVSGSTTDVFENHPFIQAGAGVRVDLKEGYKARIEGKFLKILGSDNEGNEAIITAGISIPLGYEKKVVKKPRVVRQPIVRAVPEPLPIVPSEPKIVYVDPNTCPIKIDAPDLDRDGVADRQDQCPSTPCNFTVDAYGCPVKATLKVNFATNSARIENYSMHKIDTFSNFLLSNKGSFVQIVGHTDSRGSSMKNAALSQRRANSVMQELINRGVSSSRLSAIGRGENMPLASNNTADGRAMNRRIEAVLTYPNGRR